MGQRIDQFCENLRVKLTSVDKNMQTLKAEIDGKAKTAEKDVQNHLNGIKKRIEQDRAKVSAAQADVKKWVEGRKVATSEKVAEWKAKLETAKLKARADDAESYAAAAAVIAVAAIDEAEQAAVEAWLARRDAESAGTK